MSAAESHGGIRGESTEANKQLIRRQLAEMWNAAGWDAIGEFLDPAILVHGAGDEPLRGHKALIKALEQTRTAFPDRTYTLDDLVAEGDLVAARWTFRGSHGGPFFVFPPTGKAVVAQELAMFRFANGTPVEMWYIPDVVGTMRQLGVLPGQGSDAAPAAGAGSEEASQAEGSGTSTPEENKAAVRRGLQQIWNENRWSASEELYSPNLAVHAASRAGAMTVDEFGELSRVLHSAFSDYNLALEALVAEGDRVAARWIVRGTHDGDFYGFDPTGRRIESPELAIFRFEGGKAREMWLQPNLIRELQQIGAVPGPPTGFQLLVVRVLRAVGLGRLLSRRMPKPKPVS